MSKFLTRESKQIIITGDEYEGDLGYPNLGGETWKLDMGAKCNDLIELAEEMECQNQVLLTDRAKKLRSIVARVAQFEELEKE